MTGPRRFAYLGPARVPSSSQTFPDKTKGAAMADLPLHRLSLAETSRLIHDGSLSPVELTEALLARIDALDPGLQAFLLVTRERALAAARAAELELRAGQDRGPLHGIPYAAKDIFDVGGLPTTAGATARAEAIAAADCTVVKRLTDAGMVLLGKTRTVQFAMGAPGINHQHGTPHNPWHQTHHVPGGSSNGSAVAVAAGLVPMALGSDTGGSVRIPAALCGTAGLKTTVGQVSRAGVFPLSGTLDSVGPLTRRVEDAALCYQAMLGADPADRSTRDFETQDAVVGLADGVKGLRIGVAEGVFWEQVDPEVAQAVRDSAEVLAGLGARVESFDFPEAAAALAANPGSMISGVEACYNHDRLLGPDFDDYDSVLTERIAFGRKTAAADYVRAIETCLSLRNDAARRIADFDAFLAPSTAIPAKPLAEVDASLESYNRLGPLYSRNTSVGNLLGLCGLSLPCGFSGDGLPIGLMIHGKPRAEAMVLRVGQAYEEATEWHRRTPDLSWLEG